MNFARFVYPGVPGPRIPRIAEITDVNPPTNGDNGVFRMVYSMMINNKIPLAMYKSLKTGLTICIADVSDPIVSCHFAIATEVFTDNGLPEAVSHLVLMGSEDYPYKNLLTRWSHKCYSLDAEIHTFQDYTCYSMRTSETEGFFSLLPVYLDHILYPTLSEAAYIINVHHITKYGDNGGTFYFDTRTKELDGEYVTYTELMKAMYPESCGYSSIVQGTSNYISEYLVLEDIRQYHEEYYRPENLTVLIVGQVDHTKVLDMLLPLEEKIISKGDRGEFKRPWQTPIKPLTKSIDVEFQYPCYSCTGAYIRIAWQGPPIYKMYDYFSFCLISQYLTDTTEGVLQKEFAKEQIFYEYYFHEFSTSALSLMFSNVPGSKVPLVKESVIKVLKHTTDVGIELKRMKIIIRRYIIKILNDLENNPHNTIANGLFKHMLYGKSLKDLNHRLNIIHYLKILENESKSYWYNLYKKYFVETPMVVVKGTPSHEMLKIFSGEERKRKIDRMREFGMLGLARNDILLSQAISENVFLLLMTIFFFKSHIPDEVLESIPVPDINSIVFRHIKNYSTETLEQHPELDVKLLPLFTYIENTDTMFIYMFVVMDTTSISNVCKKYIPLLLELIMESPVKRDDQLIPYKEVIDELKADTVLATTQISLHKPMAFSYKSSSVYLILTFEYEKYEKGVKWIKELLYDTVLTVDRLKEVATNKLNSIAQLKTEGERVTDDLMKIALYNEDSNPYMFSLLQQEEFLIDILQRLDNDVDQKEIMANIESSRKVLTLSENMVLYMTLNIMKLIHKVPNVYAPWKTFFSDVTVAEGKTNNKVNITNDWTLLSSTNHIAISRCIVGLENETNAFFLRAHPCINDYRNPDLPALLVCLMYLDQMDGPLSLLIRHSERARDYEFFVSLHEGLLYLAINDATDLVGAYTKAKKNTENRMFGQWTDIFCESAKSLTIFQLVRMKNAIGNRANESLRCCRGLPLDYCVPLMRDIPTVTKDDMSRVTVQYITPLFDPEACKTIIVCHKSVISVINETFKGMHHSLNTYSNFKEAYLILSKKT
ncbi:Uncharacterized protein C05D11.1 [Cyphomyrmex costatus]|uniref:Uncharacterized protein C05D11.1 n=1 Tax=Cyphomyrmex costatus TaxID=456900 RepID=A0A151IHG3_9HYME|nr:Uncharacterized protein C05D11.1 [Cyphomyrmex costatus]